MPPNIKRLPIAPLPPALKSLAEPNDLYKHLVSQAVAKNAPLGCGDYRNFATRVFSLSPTLSASLEKVAQESFDGDIKAAFTALTIAGAELATQARQAVHDTEQQADNTASLSFTPKSDLQAQFYAKITNSLDHKRIIFAEASTGIGKGRAIVAAAFKKASQLPPDSLIVVCAPTVAIVEQLYAESLTLNAQTATTSILCGATEFVDDLLLNAFLEEESDPQFDPIRKWVATGAKPINIDRPLVKSIGPDAAWLHDDLSTLCEELDINASAFTLTQDISEDSQSRQIVRQIRSISKSEKQIVFCTHAMLAIAQKTQWAILPAPKALLIDEAHLFEQSVSTINSGKISMLTIRSLLSQYRRANKLSSTHSVTKAHQAATALTATLRTIATTTTDNELDLYSLPIEHKHAVLNNLRDITNCLKNKSLATIPLTKSWLRSLTTIMQGVEHSIQSGSPSLNRTYLTLSPTKSYPSLVNGPMSVAAQLGHIWNVASEGVVLASATLYTPNESGDIKCDYMRSVLSTPLARTDIMQPIIDPNIFTTPILHIPSKHRAEKLRPSSDITERSTWHAELANTLIRDVLPTSKGGTLVLATSYADIQSIRSNIEPHVANDQPIIAMQRGTAFTTAMTTFRKLYAQGKRPIFLALGPAWTGLDLTDPSTTADKDILLTSLVITRTPLGINDSNTLRHRMRYKGMTPLTHEAMLTFKQGTGRLIRRSGITDRHLWVLDGRLFDGKPWSNAPQRDGAINQMCASLRRFLKSFKNTQLLH